jgi:hypothetical protein
MFREFLTNGIGGIDEIHVTGPEGDRLVIAANLENWQFYSIRTFVTGKSVMSEIVIHPADRWVVPVLLVVFISLGSALGILIARWFRPAALP